MKGGVPSLKSLCLAQVIVSQYHRDDISGMISHLVETDIPMRFAIRNIVEDNKKTRPNWNRVWDTVLLHRDQHRLFKKCYTCDPNAFLFHLLLTSFSSACFNLFVYNHTMEYDGFPCIFTYSTDLITVAYRDKEIAFPLPKQSECLLTTAKDYMENIHPILYSMRKQIRNFVRNGGSPDSL